MIKKLHNRYVIEYDNLVYSPLRYYWGAPWKGDDGENAIFAVIDNGREHLSLLAWSNSSNKWYRASWESRDTDNMRQWFGKEEWSAEKVYLWFQLGQPK